MKRLARILEWAWPVVLLGAGCANPGAHVSTGALVPAPGSPFAINANCVAIADVNGDRHQDLILTVGTHLQTHFGDGAGNFKLAPDNDLDTHERATELALGDVNGDGNVDVVLADHDRYSVSVFLGDGKGGFAPAPGLPFWPMRGPHPHTHGLLLCDVNNDGKLDLITANNADADIAVMLGDGRGGFTSAAKSVFPCGPSPYPMAAVDVNGDGNLDILVPNSKPGLQTMTVLLGNGKGEFAPAPGSPVKTPGDDVYFVTTGDLVGDGRQLYALLSNNHNDHATILIKDARGNFKLAPNSPLRMGNRGWQMAIVDFDRDGKPDLIAVTETGVRVFFGDGRGGFRPDPLVVPSGGKGCWKLAMGDLNEDGIPDVATPNVETQNLTILLSHK
jgi:hypothetical protein